MKAKMARFYGFGASEIELMPLYLFWEYFNAIKVVESQERLHRIEAAISPHLKQEKRKELITDLQFNIKSKIDRTEGKQGNIEDVAKAFARMGNFGEKRKNSNRD